MDGVTSRLTSTGAGSAAEVENRQTAPSPHAHPDGRNHAHRAGGITRTERRPWTRPVPSGRGV